MSHTVYIVDGYNLLHFLFPGADREAIFARRDWLADRLASYAGLQAAGVVLVFDGSGARTTSGRPIAGADLEVCFAGGRFSADTLIARRIAEQPPDVQTVVVSADQEVQRTAARAGVRRMTPRELAPSLIGDVSADEESDAGQAKGLASSHNTYRMPSRLEDKVDPETLRKLEHLRDRDD